MPSLIPGFMPRLRQELDFLQRFFFVAVIMVDEAVDKGHIVC